MLSWLHERKRGQSVVLVALSATVLLGIIALGMDAGRLYFQRRDVQNGADAGALAGAQELLPQSGNPGVTTQMASSARCQATIYALITWGDTPNTDCSVWAGSSPTARVQGTNSPATVTVTTPSRGNPNEVAVRVDYNVPLTFASVMGFQNSVVSAIAYAHGGFYNKVYTVFGFSTTGSGNSVFDDQSGYAQIDDGFNGADMCNHTGSLGKMVSNAKFHVPNPERPAINLNGTFFYAQASDTHAIVTYWIGSVSPSSSNIDPIPNYEPPLPPTKLPQQSLGNAFGHAIHYFYPGLYQSDLTIPFETDRAGNDYYIFYNGIYEFLNANLTINGGTISNTSTGQPIYKTFSTDGFTGGITDLPPASDGTNGVEFVFDGNASFSASSSTNVYGPHIFLVAPSYVSSGTDSIAFFVKMTDTIQGPNGTPWSERIDPRNPGAFFQIYGTIFNQDNNGSNGTVAVLQAVSTQLGGAGQPNYYAVTGEFVGPQANLYNGNIATQASITPSTPCPPNGSGAYSQNPAGLLVQFSPHYAPHFRGFSFLVK